MFYCLSRTLLHRRCTVTGSASAQKLSLLQKLPFSQLSPKPILAKVNQHSLLISFLINACGLSPKSALSASKKLHFKTSERPNLVRSFFRDHGFSQTQISKIIGRTPELLLYQPEKSLLPKFEFFYSKGISSSDLAALVYTCPRVIITGLESKIVPSFNCLEELLKSKDKAIAAIKHFPFILCHDIEGKVAILRDHGVPDPNIALFVRRWPHLSMSNPDKFNQTVEVVKEMGINPLKSPFVIAIVAVKQIGKDVWERKVNLYKSWGCSEEQIIASFTKFPWCMLASENKISSAMDFFVKKMGWEANAVVERPILISLSLDKRILPRAPVLQFALSKGLLEEKVSKVAWMFTCPEKRFLRKCLTWHKYEPQLLQLYRDKLDLCKVTEGSI